MLSPAHGDMKEHVRGANMRANSRGFHSLSLKAPLGDQDIDIAQNRFYVNPGGWDKVDAADKSREDRKRNSKI